MKNKWLIVLFIFFLGVILLSLWITQQSQKAVSLSEQVIPITAQAESRISPVYLPQVSPTPIARLPLVKSGITIIKAPTIEPENTINPVAEIKEETVNNSSSSSVASNAKAEDGMQAGVTRIGKQPSLKESKEMNSNGIVLY